MSEGVEKVVIRNIEGVSSDSCEKSTSVKISKYLKCKICKERIIGRIGKEYYDNILLGNVFICLPCSQELHRVEQIKREIPKDMSAALTFLITMLEQRVPYVKGFVSVAGHVAHIYLTIGLTPQDEWRHGQIENSPYGKFEIDQRGIIKKVSGWRVGQYKDHIAQNEVDAYESLVEWISESEGS